MSSCILFQPSAKKLNHRAFVCIMMPKINIHWFRRDLRLNDNAALYHALKSDKPVLCVFIFDKTILHKLENNYDKRVDFIHQTIIQLKNELEQKGSSLLIKYNTPIAANIISGYLLVTFLINNLFSASLHIRSAMDCPPLPLLLVQHHNQIV